jgi:hypothetical protein
MKSLFVFVLLLTTLLSRLSYADPSRRFFRVACVPEAGLLDIEPRYLAEKVWSAESAWEQKERNTALARAGLHDPHALNISCVLGGDSYVITTDQGEPTDAMCGGDPGIDLTVTRNNEALLSRVFFGPACGQASVTRFTVGVSSKSKRGQETEFCYSSGKDGVPDYCEWTGSVDDLKRDFPVDQDRLERIAKHQERR